MASSHTLETSPMPPAMLRALQTPNPYKPQLTPAEITNAIARWVLESPL